jgi:hypothetical protein
MIMEVALRRGVAVWPWPRSGGAEFVSAALVWPGVGAEQSYRLHGRRTN